MPGRLAGHLTHAKLVTDFKPPLQNPVVSLLAKAFLPFGLWWGYYDGIDIDEDSRLHLIEMRGKRAIICANHSKGHDPGIIFSLRRYLHEDFRYLAAREIFDRWHGLLGWLIQRVGAYSVERAICDRKAIFTTVKLLLEGKHKLVVFPEGIVSNRGDRLLPVERGLTRVFLKACATLHAAAPGAPLYMVPLGLRYRYTQDISGNLSNALLRIELTLKIQNHHLSLPERFLHARRAVLFNLTVPKEAKRSRWLFDQAQQAELVKTLESFSDDDLLQENLASGIDLMERLLYTRVTQKGHRRVTVRVGKPIDLSGYLPEYERDRHAAAESLARDLEQQLAELAGVPDPSSERRLTA